MSASNPSSQLHDPDYDVAVRDPEAAAQGLALVQQLLDEGEDAADRKDLKVGEEIKKEHRDTLSELHPADIAYILKPFRSMNVSSFGTACAPDATAKFWLKSMKVFEKP